MRKKDVAKELGNEFEINQYIHALGTSSTHVRFVMLAIIIAIIAAATTLWSSQEESWEKARINKFYDEFTKAEANKIWENELLYEPDKCPKAPEKVEPAFRAKLWQLLWKENPDAKEHNAAEKLAIGEGEENAKALKAKKPLSKSPKAELLKSYKGLDTGQLCEVLTYFKNRGVTNEDEAERYAEKLYEAYVNNMLYIQVPVLGTIFDVNDLGLVTGVTFFVLMLVMSFYTHRAHENLAVCMWKVHEMAEREQCFDVPGGKPNLLYHALAMQQVFTIPPTLARWRDNWLFRYFHYVLFVLPFFTEFAVTYHDVRTADIGTEYSIAQTQLSLRMQTTLLCLVLFLCILCCSHLYADDVLWKRIFLFINPAHRFKGKARWIHWTHIAQNVTPGWGLIAKNNTIFLNDTVRSSIWKVTSERIEYQEKSSGKGLYLKDGEIRQYSSKPGNFPRFKRVMWWFQFWKNPIAWSGNPQAQPYSGSEAITGLSDAGDHLQVWERKLERNRLPVSSSWRLGGAEQQVDGTGSEVGFQDIRAIIPNGRFLFVTDGAWVREIDEGGTVTTWGGQPLAQVVRREPPLLLGMHYVGNIGIKPERKFDVDSIFKPEVLVCDFSTRRVFGVAKDAATEVYKSKWGWTPSGIFVDNDQIYLLEYRRGFVWNELVTSWQTTNNPLGHLFRGRNYVRVMRFSGGSFSSRPRVLFQISPGMARKVKDEAHRALKGNREAEGIRNYDWRTSGFGLRVLARLGLLPCYLLVRIYLRRV